MYLYLVWIIHHLDLIDHYIFQFSQTLVRKCSVYTLRFERSFSKNLTSNN
jgi:hypothetical protein